MTSQEAVNLIRGLKDLDVEWVGMDLVEVSPPFDPGYITALAGANLMFEFLCLLVPSVLAH
jgi:arginase family enzyme